MISFNKSTHAYPKDLKQYQWKNRLILVFAPNAENKDLQSILKQFDKQKCEMQNRDLVAGLFTINNKAMLDNDPLDFESSAGIKRFYELSDNEFTAILVGKDGHEKQRYKEAPNLGEIFSTIDRMPMRIMESKLPHSSCS